MKTKAFLGAMLAASVLAPTSPPSGSVAVVVEPEWQGSGMNDDTEPIGISTRKGIDPNTFV